MCDGTQNFKRYRYRYFFLVPNIFDTDTGTFFGTNFFRYRFRDFFPVPNFSDTGSETFFRYQIFPIPVPIPPEKMNNSRYRYLDGTGTHYKSSKFQNLCDKIQFRYQIFSDTDTGTFSGTKFFRYRFRDFFPVPNFSDTGSDTFSGTNFFRYRFRYHQKNEKFPVPGIPGTGTSHSAWP